MSSLSLFRIAYNAGEDHAVINNYFYYNAVNSKEAISFHESMLKRKKATGQIISVERHNPYSQKWEDETDNTTTNKPKENHGVSE